MRAGWDGTLHFDTTSRKVYPVCVLQGLLEYKCSAVPEVRHFAQVRLTLIPKVSVIHSRLWDCVVNRCASAYAQSLCENTNHLYFEGAGLWYWHSLPALDRQYF